MSLAASPSATLTLTGTGTSVGVPMVGCDCEVCTSPDPRNKRFRSGCVVRVPEATSRHGERTFVIDTAPELRLQLLRTGVSHVDAALFTHAHADHIMGLDDLRICSLRADGPLPLYAEETVHSAISRTFPYAFMPPPQNAHSGAVPQYQQIAITLDPFDLFGLTIQPLRLWHGKLPVLGFRINDVAFCTDCSRVDDSAMPLLEGLETLVIDALRYADHPTHFNIEQAVSLATQLKPRQTYLTHIAHDVEHATLARELPPTIAPAFDGLEIPVGSLVTTTD